MKLYENASERSAFSAQTNSKFTVKLDIIDVHIARDGWSTKR